MSGDKLDPGKLRGILEAVLMTADQPVSPGKLQSLCKGASGKDLRRAIDDLNDRYARGEHAMTISEVAGGFQFVTRSEFGPWVRKFHDRSQIRISQAALETLAIIAFKQPVTRVEVDSVRGVDSGGVLRTLLELNMIRIVGRSEGVGRPMLFGTTREFMTHFGLKSLADLPRPKELEELLAEGERKAQAAHPADEPPPTGGDADPAADQDSGPGDAVSGPAGRTALEDGATHPESAEQAAAEGGGALGTVAAAAEGTAAAEDRARPERESAGQATAGDSEGDAPGQTDAEATRDAE